MFNRGGVAKNTGIVSGFDPDPQGRVGFKDGDLVTTPQERTAQVMQAYRDAGILQDPKMDRSFTPADYLMIASTGAKIMGAPATGQGGLGGALTAAANPLADLGMNLAGSYQNKQESYRTQKALQDDFKAQAIGIGFDQDLDEFQRVLQAMTGLEDQMAAIQTEGDPAYIEDEEKRNAAVAKLERQYLTLLIRESGQDITGDAQLIIAGTVQQIMKEQYPNLIPGTKGYKEIADEITRQESLKIQLPSYDLSDIGGSSLNKGGRVGLNMGGNADAEEISSAEEAAILAQQKQMSQKQNALMQLIESQRSMGVKNSNRVIEEIERKGSVLSPSDKNFIMERNNALNSYNAMMRDKTGQMGRGDVPGYYNQGGLTSADRADVREQSSVMQNQTELSFEELRARLPQEVTDSVVRLLASSTSALLDFANIETEQDIAMFNQKYQSDLQLPTQVA